MLCRVEPLLCGHYISSTCGTSDASLPPMHATYCSPSIAQTVLRNRYRSISIDYRRKSFTPLEHQKASRAHMVKYLRPQDRYLRLKENHVKIKGIVLNIPTNIFKHPRQFLWNPSRTKENPMRIKPNPLKSFERQRASFEDHAKNCLECNGNQKQV